MGCTYYVKNITKARKGLLAMKTVAAKGISQMILLILFRILLVLVMTMVSAS